MIDAAFYDGMMRSANSRFHQNAGQLICVAIAVAGCAASKPPASQPAPIATQPVEISPAAALSQALSMLVREARQAKAQQKYPREAADFASTFAGKPDPEAVGARLVRPANDDPFIDGYVRWQLTSFQPPMPDLTVVQLQRMLDRMPALVDNPRSDSVLIAELTASARGGILTKPTQELMNRRIAQMDQRTMTVESFNRAPMGFREWLRGQVEPGGTRQVLLAIEECHAVVLARWNCDPAKQRLEALVNDASKNLSLSPDDRQIIRESLLGLSGLRALYVQSAVIQNDVLIVEYAETAVDDFEIRRWMKLVSENE